MNLITAGASPFARKVEVLIRESGLDDLVERITVATAPGATDATLKSANPMGRLPALLREDGPALYDSPVICRYLDAQANSGLYPDNDWDALVLEATV